jgi:hypothetical protein
MSYPLEHGLIGHAAPLACRGRERRVYGSPRECLLYLRLPLAVDGPRQQVRERVHLIG